VKIKLKVHLNILGRNCSMAQIMAVTGHKSASSGKEYLFCSYNRFELKNSI
jgi:ATP-dependent protease ClpP protease subunit